MRLTQKYIDRVQGPKRGQVFLRDESMPGFGLKITARGTKTYFIEKQIGRRGRRLTLGRTGALTLDAARKLAQAHLSRLLMGAIRSRSGSNTRSPNLR